MVELGREESLKLLATVSHGPRGFTHQALPVIRPVNHLVTAEGDVVIRTHAGAALLTSASASEVVVYEADQIDEDASTGWSVMATRTARRVTDPQKLSRYHAELTAWSARTWSRWSVSRAGDRIPPGAVKHSLGAQSRRSLPAWERWKLLLGESRTIVFARATGSASQLKKDRATGLSG
ncbi:pyridoxamine 5'-phosphate oxidase family protein [Streptomyces sp. CA-142005]|uniref:pyridoxamine 5'-phosphate oxidase family protein n=1 Tax=Streptomyces sp. CA-142005 TaxID=3240052 RepID=UPI003D94F859